MRLSLRARLRITSCNSPFGPHFVRSNLLHANLVADANLLQATVNSDRKVTKKNAAPTSLTFGFPRHSPLPTGRPDSPSGLDRTKSGVLPAINLFFLGPTKAECLGKLHGETVPPVKLAEACPVPAEADSFTDRVD